MAEGPEHQGDRKAILQAPELSKAMIRSMFEKISLHTEHRRTLQTGTLAEGSVHTRHLINADEEISK